MRTLTPDEIRKRIEERNGGRYDLSETECKTYKDKVEMTCHRTGKDGTEHGKFRISVNNFLRGQGCPKCGKERSAESRRMTTEEFVRRVQEARKGKEVQYGFDKAVFTGYGCRVTIFCPIHGYVDANSAALLHGCGCPKCGRESGARKNTYTKEEFVEKASIVHNGFYSYGKVSYVNSDKEVVITCPIHGDFLMKPCYHLSGCGCKECAREKARERNAIAREEYVRRCVQTHGDRYGYGETEYKGMDFDVTVLCPIHGRFRQNAYAHMRGCNCPQCARKAPLMEEELFRALSGMGLCMERQKKFKWLRRAHPLSLDLYSERYGVGIECQGLQHFAPVDFAGNGEGWARNLFEENRERDAAKAECCKSNGVRLLYYTTDKILERCGGSLPDSYAVGKNLFTDINELCDNIKSPIYF